jgi:hypothetical protein
VGQLDDHRGGSDLGPAGIAEVGRQHAHQRSKPLAAGLDEMARHLVDELVIGANGNPQPLLDLFQARPDGRFEIGVVELDAEGGAGAQPGRFHVISLAAFVARSNTGWGNTPSNNVTPTEMVSAIVVAQPGIATVGPSSGGSAKNIKMMMRR